MPSELAWPAALLLAAVIDGLTGEPPALYRRVPHPVVAIGAMCTGLEARLWRAADGPAAKRRAGIFLVLLVLALTLTTAAILATLCRALPLGWLIEAALISTLLAARSLYDHVAAVAAALSRDLEAGRAAVAHIVGRDPRALDEAGVARAAIESTAENLSDGVVAPLFWALLLGLPGIAAYKAINTLDSMVGHRSARYRDFGWASARLDDLVNLVPARLTALALLGAAAVLPSASAGGAWRIVRRDAGRHRSPNAGWPEAAMAGALGLRLAGPRVYPDYRVADPWLGDGRADPGPADIRRALQLAALAYLLVLGGLVLLMIT